jgi:hypothetical protein
MVAGACQRLLGVMGRLSRRQPLRHGRTLPLYDMTPTSPSPATPPPHAHRLLRSQLRSLHSFPHSFILPSIKDSATLLTHLQYPSSISIVAGGSSVVSNNTNSYFLIRRSCSTGCKGEGVAWSGVEWSGVVGCVMIGAITPPFPSTLVCKTYQRLKNLTLCRAGVAGIS